MIIRLQRFVSAAVITLTLTACGTTPNSNYYLLSSEATDIPAQGSLSLGVGPIEIPEYLNRNAFVLSRDNNQLHVASFERWAEPLDGGIERVMRLNLASLLDTQNVQSYPFGSKEKPQYAVEVTILRLDANNSGASLIAEWRLHRPQLEQTVSRHINRLHQDISSNPLQATDIAPAYSRLLMQLSEVIATAISAVEASQAASENR